MIYGASITASAGGSAANPDRTTLKVTKGLIWLVEVDFPPGCAGLMNVQILDGKYQICPASVGYSLKGDWALLTYDDLYLKEAAPWELTIITWNEDELWDHTVQVRIGMVSARLFMARYMPTLAWEDFAQEMERVREGQAAQYEQQMAAIFQQLNE